MLEPLGACTRAISSFSPGSGVLLRYSSVTDLRYNVRRPTPAMSLQRRDKTTGIGFW